MRELETIAQQASECGIGWGEQGRNAIARARDVYRHLGTTALDEAAESLAGVISAAAGCGAADIEVEALVELAVNRRHARQFDRADGAARRALEQSEATDNRPGEASAYVELARIAIALNRYAAADAQLRRALSLAGSRDPGLSARVHYARAKLARRRGHLAISRSELRKAIPLFEVAGDRYGMARALARLGYIDRICGALDRAEEGLHRSLDMAKAHNFPLIAAHALLDLGQLARYRRKYEEALWRTHAAFCEFWAIGDSIGVAHTYGAFAVLYRLTGETGLLHAATNYAGAAVNIYVATQHSSGEALSRRRLGECLRDAGRFTEARAELEHAHDIYRTLCRDHDEALVMAAMAKLERAQQQPLLALELARKAKQKLDVARSQFQRGQDNAEFGARYAWVYAVALVCALESQSTEAESQLASLLQEGSLRRAAREQLSRLSGKIGSLIGEIAECQAALTIHEHTEIEEATIRDRLTSLCSQLKRQAPTLAMILDSHWPVLEVWTAPGVHVLSVDAQGDDGAWVAWESPKGETIITTRPLARSNGGYLADLAAGTRDARWDARPRRLERLAKALLPEGLQRALLAGEVSVLRVVPSLALRRVPFGELRLGTHRLDELACVVWVALPPSEEAPGADDGPVLPPRGAHRDPRPDGGPRGALGLLDPALAPSAPLWDKVRLETLFETEPQVLAALTQDVNVLRDQGVSLPTAVRIVKSAHRARCGPTCPPAHLGGLVVTVDPDANLDGASTEQTSDIEGIPAAATVRGDEWYRVRPITLRYDPDAFVVLVDVPDSDDIDIVEPAPGVMLVFNRRAVGQLLMMKVQIPVFPPGETWTLTVSTLLGPTLYDLYRHHASNSPPALAHQPPPERVRLQRPEWLGLRQVSWLALHQSVAPDLVKLPSIVGSRTSTRPHSLVVMASLPPARDVAPSNQPGANFVLPDSVARAYRIGTIGYVAALDPATVTIRFDAANPHPAPLVVRANSGAVGAGAAQMEGDELVTTLRHHGPINRALSLCLEWSSGAG